jgi:hypothetical protein
MPQNAVKLGAEYIVTGDKALKAEGEYQGIKNFDPSGVPENDPGGLIQTGFWDCLSSGYAPAGSRYGPL